MACSSPVPRYWAATINPSGRRSLVRDFSLSTGSGVVVWTRCGSCIRCKLDRASDWAIRISHEASLYRDNCFITLTYSNDDLPKGNSLVKSHFQDFMKRLRDWSLTHRGRSLRYYASGEYGDLFGRPHYHAILLDFDFPDKVREVKRGDYDVFSSAILRDKWKFGHSEIGSVTHESAGYVARYCTKKITGDMALEHYHYVDENGSSHWRQPEFSLQSQSIGKPWLERFHTDVYNGDFVFMNGAKLRPPRAYDKRFEVLFPEEFAAIKKARIRRVREAPDYSARKFYVREEIARSRLALFAKRKLE